MAWITDSLKGALTFAGRLNPFQQYRDAPLAGVFTHQLALASYMSSGMMRKVISIPAADRAQKWRDWQTDKDNITKIEAEEKRLDLQAKTKHAEVLRGVGGGAMILIAAGDHDKPLGPESIGPLGLIAINVVSRWQITPEDFDDNLASPTYGQPRMFSVDSRSGGKQMIHPSRVVCFRGAPLPQGSAVSDVDAFWGDSQLLRVFREIERSDHAQEWFAALIRKAKLLRIGIPDLLDLVATDAGKQQLNERIALIATGESTLNATVYRSGTGADDPGEKIDDYQVNWTGIPAMMDAFDQRVAAVSDIPFTRLTGRSPAGMNATGKHDMDNWRDAISAGQENETRPCLEVIDPLLLRSAGVAQPEDVWWTWAPLDKPDEKEKAETFKLLMEGIDKLIMSGLVPERALAQAVQNLIEERGDLPGLADALAELSKDERFGGGPDEDDDPSAIIGEGGDPDLRGGVRRAANDAAHWLTDATPRPLYVQRKLLNAAELIAWAKGNGFDTTLPADDMHVTVLYSRAEVDPMKMGRSWAEDEKGRLTVRPGGPRVIERLGENAVVLRFASPDLEYRHREMIEAGGSHDWPEYAPHVTISYGVPEGVDVEAIKPFNGELRFGPEEFSALDLDWKSKIAEA